MLVIYENSGNTEKEANREEKEERREGEEYMRAQGREGETVHESTAKAEPRRISFSGSGSG